jgi:hypothetical protein
MKSSRAVLTAIVVILVVGGGFWVMHRRAVQRIDLLAQFDQAEKKPAADQFSVIDATLAGETKKAIAAPSNGRIIFKVKIPDDGYLRLSLGTKPESWEKEGDGVYFFGGVTDASGFTKEFEQTLNPFQNPSERRWIPVAVDLAPYAGQEVQIILNTRSSGPGRPADDRNDMPLWGAPVLGR